MSKSGRPSWWEVPPYGYLEIESRNAPTRPRALRTLARVAARAGLSWSPEHPLPAQGFVEAHERARLVFHARRELPRVTAVASQVMVTESRLTEAEALLRQAASDRSAATARRRAAERGGPAPTEEDAADVAGGQPSTAAAPRRGQPGWRYVLGPWSEAVVLAVVGGGEGALGYVVGRDLGLAPLTLALLTAAAAVGSIAAAQLTAHGVDRLAVTPDGSDDPDRRRLLDLTVAGAALACGLTLAVAMGYISAGAGPAAVGLALFGLATAVSYAAIPDRSDTGGSSRSRSLAARLRRLQENRRSRRQLRLAQAREADAQAAVNQLREELALLVPQLFAAEQAALLFWRYQVAIGDAAQHAFQQHLAAFSKRRSRGVWRPIVEWWSGTTPAASDDGDGVSFASVGEAQSEWGDQVARVTMAAKRVLVRRGLLDITHGLRLSRLPGTPPAGRDGRPAPSDGEAVPGDGERPLVAPPPFDPDQPGQR
ncbi:MAG TPA: hypothetical protein VF486_05730 [Actinomycetes bacterium]